MGLAERLLEEMKAAMKSNDKVRLSTIRMIRSAVKNREIDLRKPLDEEEIQRVIQGMIRKGEESLEQFRLGGRMDLVEKEGNEIQILKSYLPESMTREALVIVIDQAIKETESTSIRDLGKVMKSVISKVQGKADGKLINQLVKDRLSS